MSAQTETNITYVFTCTAPPMMVVVGSRDGLCVFACLEGPLNQKGN